MSYEFIQSSSFCFLPKNIQVLTSLYLIWYFRLEWPSRISDYRHRYKLSESAKTISQEIMSPKCAHIFFQCKKSLNFLDTFLSHHVPCKNWQMQIQYICVLNVLISRQKFSNCDKWNYRCMASCHDNLSRELNLSQQTSIYLKKLSVNSYT
jgi:hypothetical protein